MSFSGSVSAPVLLGDRLRERSKRKREADEEALEKKRRTAAISGLNRYLAEAKPEIAKILEHAAETTGQSRHVINSLDRTLHPAIKMVFASITDAEHFCKPGDIRNAIKLAFQPDNVLATFVPDDYGHFCAFIAFYWK